MAATEFTWYPDVGSEQQAKPSVSALKFGDGYEQRLAAGINAQAMKWTVTFTRLRAEALAILAYLRLRNGVEAFNWTNPLQETGIYVCREWTTSQMKGGAMTISCAFEQVFE